MTEASTTVLDAKFGRRRQLILRCAVCGVIILTVFSGFGGAVIGAPTASPSQQAHISTAGSAIDEGQTANATTASAGSNITYLLGNGEAQTLVYTGSEVVVVGEPIDSANGAGETTVQLRSVDDTDDGVIVDSSAATTHQIETDFSELAFAPSDAETPSGDPPEAFVRVATDELSDGEYFIRDDDDRVAETTANTVEITQQQLTASWADDTVELAADEAELDIDSQRTTFNINVSAPGVDYDELESLFLDDTNTTQLDANAPRLDRQPFASTEEASQTGGLSARTEKAATFADEDIIVLQGGNDKTLHAIPSESEIDQGTYTFNVSVTDATATAEAGVTLADVDTDASFSQKRYETAAGDILNITVELSATDDAYLVFGDPAVGYLDVIYIADETDDDTVELTVNTRLIGTQPQPGIGSSGGDSAFRSDDDTVTSLAATNNAELPGTVDDAFAGLRFESAPGDLVATDEAVAGVDGSLNALRSEVGLSPIVRPLQPAAYSLALSTDGIIRAPDSETVTPADERDFAVAELAHPHLETATIGTAPAAAADEASLSTLQDRSYGQDTIAENDRLIVRFDATGYLGELTAIPPTDDLPQEVIADTIDVQRLSQLSDRANGLSITLAVGSDSPNRPTTEFDLSDTDEDVMAAYVDPDTHALYIVADLDAGQFTDIVSPGDTIEATMEYETPDDRYRFASEDTSPHFDTHGPFDGGKEGDPQMSAHPYLPADETIRITANTTVAAPDVTFDHGTTDQVYMEYDETAVLNGSSTLAPGSTLQFRILNNDPSSSLAVVDEATVEPDQRFAVTVNTTSGQPGQELVIETSRGTTDISDHRGRLVPTLAAVDIEEPSVVEKQLAQLTIDRVAVPEGGFIAVHEDDTGGSDRLGPGAEVRGVSEYLPAGTHESVDIELDRPFRDNTTATAVLYRTPTESAFSAPSTQTGVQDRPYTIRDTAVADSVPVSIVDPTSISQPQPPRERQLSPAPPRTPQSASAPTDRPPRSISATEADGAPTVSTAQNTSTQATARLTLPEWVLRPSLHAEQAGCLGTAWRVEVSTIGNGLDSRTNCHRG